MTGDNDLSGAVGSRRGYRDPEVTSQIMSRVRGKDSRAELLLRSHLHQRGVRYRLHARDIAGRPDLVIRWLELAVFVDGDFWHGNEHHRRGLQSIEELFPTNTDWWVAKIQRNIERDREVTARLEGQGWTVLRFWESDVLANPDDVAKRIHDVIERAKRERGRA